MKKIGLKELSTYSVYVKNIRQIIQDNLSSFNILNVCISCIIISNIRIDKSKYFSMIYFYNRSTCSDSFIFLPFSYHRLDYEIPIQISREFPTYQNTNREFVYVKSGKIKFFNTTQLLIKKLLIILSCRQGYIFFEQMIKK